MTSYQEQIAAQHNRYQQALANLAGFQQYMNPTGEIDFKFPHARHHQIVAEAFQRIEQGQTKRLLIMMPPGSAKSTIANQFLLWHWARNPDHQIICASNSMDLATSLNLRRRNAAQTDLYTQLSVPLDKNKLAASKFSNQAGGTMMCVGVGSAVAGYRADLALVDDAILNFEQSRSDTQLQKIWEWLGNDFITRLKPDAPLIFIGTRWALRDPQGRILQEFINEQGQDWEVIRLPMEADDPYDLLNRKLGEPLWPEWFTQEQLTEAKADNTRWTTLYQNLPIEDKGSWIGGSHNIIYNGTQPDHDKLKIRISIDLAYSKNRGDYTVFAVTGVDQQRHLHVLEIQRRQVAPLESMDMLFKLVLQYPNAVEVLIDDDTASKVWVGTVREKMLTTRNNFHINMMKTKGKDKEVRAVPLRNLLHAQRLFFNRGEWNAAVERELMEFPAGGKGHDDIIDALALPATILNYTAGYRPPEAQANDTPKGNTLIKDGQMFINAGLNDLFEDKPQTLSIVRRRI